MSADNASRAGGERLRLFRWRDGIAAPANAEWSEVAISYAPLESQHQTRKGKPLHAYQVIADGQMRGIVFQQEVASHRKIGRQRSGATYSVCWGHQDSVSAPRRSAHRHENRRDAVAALLGYDRVEEVLTSPTDSE